MSAGGGGGVSKCSAGDAVWLQGLGPSQDCLNTAHFQLQILGCWELLFRGELMFQFAICYYGRDQVPGLKPSYLGLTRVLEQTSFS